MADIAKKDNFLNKASRFFKDVKGETKKVVWPTWSQTVNNTGIVIAAIIIAGVFLAVVDVILGGIITGTINNDFIGAFKNILMLK